MEGISEKIEKELLKTEEVPFEEIAAEESSPLNEKVEENEIGFNETAKDKLAEKGPEKSNEKQQTMKSSENKNNIAAENMASSTEEKKEEKNKAIKEESSENTSEETHDDEFNTGGQMDDAPQQEIGSGQPKAAGAGEDFELPEEHAQIAAESFLGIADNLIEVGGGYFIKIRKHKDFYDFEEIIQLIDQQNDKNVNRIKLDEQDKMLLRPLLVAVLKRKAKRLTPEQQLIGVAISIIMKKAKIVMEVRAENEILVERMLDIIKIHAKPIIESSASEATVVTSESEKKDSDAPKAENVRSPEVVVA